MRRENRFLADENLKLKRLLRENGISWSPIALAHLQQTNPAKRMTRAGIKAREPTQLKVPVEVLLRIVEFSLSSSQPIIDPLSPRKLDNLTDREKTSSNKIAINILATCKSLNVDGKRYLWERNTFTFTSPEALRNFANLDAGIRAKITHVNFRVIAQYWDDERRRNRRKLDGSYHFDLASPQTMRLTVRPKSASPLTRGGFRCYTWSQVADFLTALGAPYTPKRFGKDPRPRLLPSLISLRMDLVNFTESLLPMPGKELHDVSNHSEISRTFNQLQLTGVPCDESGMKATAELIGIIKDNGLYLESAPTYAAFPKRLQFLSDRTWCGRLVRPTPDLDGDHLGMPAAPKEEGYPETTSFDDEFILYKHMPITRDSKERTWVPFNLETGYRLSEDSDEDTDADFPHVCPCCGEPHPGSSFLYDEDDDDDGFLGF